MTASYFHHVQVYVLLRWDNTSLWCQVQTNDTRKSGSALRWHKSCDPTWQLPVWLLRWLRKMSAASLATWLLCITVCRCESEVEREWEWRTLNPDRRSVWSNFRRHVSLVLPRRINTYWAVMEDLLHWLAFHDLCTRIKIVLKKKKLKGEDTPSLTFLDCAQLSTTCGCFREIRSGI